MMAPGIWRRTKIHIGCSHGIKDGHHAVIEMSACAQEDLEKLMSVNSLLCHPQMPAKEETICEDDPEMLPFFSEPKLI